jgi:hypothetical protein
MFGLVAWTVCILILVALRHLKEARGAKKSSEAKSTATLANRNYMNLLEAPVLFYVACLTAFVTGAASWLFVAFAWVYVGLRVAHSLIHVTYNRVAHRFPVFAASIAVLGLLWIWLSIRVFQRGGAG